MAGPYRLAVRVAKRDHERFPADDEALGRSLLAMLGDALGRGLPRPALLTVRAEQVDQYDLAPLLSAEAVGRERMLGAIAGQEGIEAAALVGVLQVRANPAPKPVRAAVVYVEWPDNRWWTAWQQLDVHDKLGAGEPEVRLAVDGWPRPGGIGGWFARARREGLKLRLQPAESMPTEPGDEEDGVGPIVH